MNFKNKIMDLLGYASQAIPAAQRTVLTAPRPTGLWHPTRNGNKAPGRTRKNAHGNQTRPNPTRRSRKTLNGSVRHLPYPRGAGMPVITMEQVKALSTRIGLKVCVRNGKCHVGATGFIVPINATVDEATALLDIHLAAA